MALHPRSEEIQAGVLKKLEELESRLSALRAKGWKITRHEDYRIGWEYVHDDYDGAPDSGDNRCGWGSLMDCIEAMEEHEEARP